MDDQAHRIANIIQDSLLGNDPAKALRNLETGFEETGNPVSPWAALRFARKHSLPVPDWVLHYFADRAERILDIAADGAPREAEAIGKALGFGASGKGQGSAAAWERREWRDLKLALAVEIEVKQGANPDSALDNTAKQFDCSPQTVKRAHDKWRDEAARALAAVCEAHGIP